MGQNGGHRGGEVQKFEEVKIGRYGGPWGARRCRARYAPLFMILVGKCYGGNTEMGTMGKSSLMGRRDLL